MRCSLQLAAIARYCGSSTPALRAQSSLASMPQAWISSAPRAPGHRGAGCSQVRAVGWLSPGGCEEQGRERREGHHDPGDDDVALALRQLAQGRVDAFEVAFQRHRRAG